MNSRQQMLAVSWLFDWKKFPDIVLSGSGIRSRRGHRDVRFDIWRKDFFLREFKNKWFPLAANLLFSYHFWFIQILSTIIYLRKYSSQDDIILLNEISSATYPKRKMVTVFLCVHVCSFVPMNLRTRTHTQNDKTRRSFFVGILFYCNLQCSGRWHSNLLIIIA